MVVAGPAPNAIQPLDFGLRKHELCRCAHIYINNIKIFTDWRILSHHILCLVFRQLQSNTLCGAVPVGLCTKAAPAPCSIVTNNHLCLPSKCGPQTPFEDFKGWCGIQSICKDKDTGHSFVQNVLRCAHKQTHRTTTLNKNISKPHKTLFFSGFRYA